MLNTISNKPAACVYKRCEISLQQLPLCCPPRDDRIWDAHPRVYLPIEKLGYVVCPYCSTEYILINP